MQKEYVPKKIELYVQEHWKKNKTFQVSEDNTKEKYYCLPMLPYPSGKLHMGHVRNYTISDVIARYQRMLGKNVLQPIGWDAFGLPAEEAAIRNNTIPSDWTYKNIKYMKKQLKSLGFSYDWDREITTCQPEYYRWEQWFFIQLYKKKLVYKKNSTVNWCPYDKTVLANEQVINSCCWRCQSKIITKKIPQWFIKIRKYAESLYNDLDKLKNWPERVKNMQRNWIGRTKGFEIIVKIYNHTQELKVFSPRLDTLIGATCVIISSTHTLSQEIAKNNKIIQYFIEKKTQNVLQEELEKMKYEGINTHLFVVHPITKKKIPIWIANFILKEYGTNTMLSVPGHNQHDWNFAIQNNLNIQYVIKNSITTEKNYCNLFTSKKGILFNSNEYNGLHSIHSTEKIYKLLLKKQIIKIKIHYKLQDWCVSRQRYWGTPIPMATLENGTIVSIPDHQLPVLLPEIKNSITHISNEINDSEWPKIRIKNQKGIRETDTFDTFMESSWYYARYTSPHFHKGMIDPIKSRYWLPVDQYIGGIEHAIMHLMYFRFYHKLLRDFQLVEFDEPVKNLLCQGMVLSEAFYYIGSDSKRHWIKSSSVLTKRNAEGKILTAETKKGKKLIYAGMIKMSKSKFNGIEPELIIDKYGADTVRLFIMFAAPVEAELEWKESGVKGIHRFLKKIWKLVYNYICIYNIKNINIKINLMELNELQKELYFSLHHTIANVSKNMNQRKTFNTAISEMMKFVNQLIKYSINDIKDQYIMKQSLISIIKMLYPFTPHFCFTIWKNFHKDSNIDDEKWPTFEEKLLIEQVSILIIQINGKKKCIMKISKTLTKEQVVLKVKKQLSTKKYAHSLNFNNIVYIPHKIFNFII